MYYVPDGTLKCGYYECPKCKKIYPPESGMVDVTFNLEEAPKKVCMCDTLMNPKKFIIPIFGFSTLILDSIKFFWPMNGFLLLFLGRVLIACLFFSNASSNVDNLFDKLSDFSIKEPAHERNIPALLE